MGPQSPRLSDRESAELVAEATGWMTRLLAMLPDARSSEELTGVEGAAARASFGALGVLMPACLTWSWPPRRIVI